MARNDDLERAICCPSGCLAERPRDERYVTQFPCGSLMFRSEARAVLEALRSPSEELIEAMAVAIILCANASGSDGDSLGCDMARAAWSAGIDHLMRQ